MICKYSDGCPADKGPCAECEHFNRPDAPREKPVVPTARLYRFKWLDGGYVVYRMCFDLTKCSLEDGIRAHWQAQFTAEDAAIEYCDHRNRMIDVYGNDTLPAQRHVWLPGSHFTMQQSASKRGMFNLTRRRPRYSVCFVINDDGLPEWSGGTKAQPKTLERAMRFVLTGNGDE